MEAHDTKLRILLEGSKQFVVPLFQRSYSWTESEWATLWQDLMDTLEPGRPLPSHFLGPIVTKPLDATPEGVSRFLVIDGQQRLTTLTIVLAALRDEARGRDDMLVGKIEDLYLRNRYAQGLQTYKLIPTQGDRDAYFHIINGDAVTGVSSVQATAHRYYREQIRDACHGDDGLSLDQLEAALVGHLEMVSITLAAGDSEYRIFESLNGKGRPLGQVDLLRNYFFMRLPDEQQKAVYEEHWRPIETLLAAAHREDFFRYQLMSGGSFVREGDVYQAWKAQLDPLPPTELVATLRTLQRAAAHYRKLVSPSDESSPEIRRRLHRLNRWGGQTMYPFLLFLYGAYDEGRLESDDVATILTLLESFLVRRLFARVPTNTLNRLFTRLPEQVASRKDLAVAVHEELSLPSRRWPGDREFVDAIQRHPLYTDSRPDQRRLILETLEQEHAHKEPPVLDGLTIEHLMPQTLTAAWRDDLGPDAVEVHQTLCHVLGNLTLTGYNPELSNAPWSEKRELLANSNLQTNRVIATSLRWGEEQIRARGQALAEMSVAIWPGPRQTEAGAEPPGGEAPTGGQWAAAFYEGCIARFASARGTALVPRTPTVYDTPDDGTVVVCLVSKEYPDATYWWTLRTRHEIALAAAPQGFLLLGCDSPDTIVVIPWSSWQEFAPRLNSTVHGETTNWHILMRREGDRIWWQPKSGGQPVDMSGRLLS